MDRIGFDIRWTHPRSFAVTWIRRLALASSMLHQNLDSDCILTGNACPIIRVRGHVTYVPSLAAVHCLTTTPTSIPATATALNFPERPPPPLNGAIKRVTDGCGVLSGQKYAREIETANPNLRAILAAAPLSPLLAQGSLSPQEYLGSRRRLIKDESDTPGGEMVERCRVAALRLL